jgi:glycosyltransferase involved in cell wall biosynthesis
MAMISLIATVLNEKNNLPFWLEGILSQSKLPDEVVIVDGGSTDGTWGWLQAKSAGNALIKIFQHQGNIASGRNFAIKNAQGDIIVATDAGCIYDNDWFAKITEPLAGGAKFAATGFGPWLNEKDGLLPHLIASCTTPAPYEFKKDWLPSSRSVAFKKDVWQKAGGYPEWIPICEDIIFDLKIKKLSIEPEYIREPLVFWRPRPSLGAYFKQIYKYTKSDGHGKLWLGRQMIRYAVYLSSLALLVLSVAVDWKFLVIIFFGSVIYIDKFWKRWFMFTKKFPVWKIVLGFFLLPLAVAFGDLAKMCGWPVGVWERMKGKIKFEKY